MRNAKPTPPPPPSVTNLVDLATFDIARAVSIRDAVRAGLLNMKGKQPSLQTAQRFANPRRGIEIGGVRVVLPTVKNGKERLLMPEWCEIFMRERTARMVAIARRLTGF